MQEITKLLNNCNVYELQSLKKYKQLLNSGKNNINHASNQNKILNEMHITLLKNIWKLPHMETIQDCINLIKLKYKIKMDDYSIDYELNRLAKWVIWTWLSDDVIMLNRSQFGNITKITAKLGKVNGTDIYTCSKCNELLLYESLNYDNRSIFHHTERELVINNCLDNHKC
jgi:hypothetical protein